MTKYLALPLLLLGSLVIAVSPSPGTETKTKSAAAPLTVALSIKADGPATTAFSAGEPTIFATYHGTALKKGDKIRFVWTVEDGGKTVVPNAKLAEFTSVADGPDGKGFSQMNKPATGWPLGKYRVDVYANDTRAASVKFTIK